MKPTKWGWIVSHPENFFLDDYVDIGAFTYINAKFTIIIDSDVEIGSHCSIYTENSIDKKIGFVKIKTGAKIGSHCMINPGVTIGENAIIGSFSFVKQDIPAGETWAGVPARKIK